MKVIPNYAKQRLLDGELALGMGLRQARTVDISQIAKSCDFDWLFIDMEHNSMSIDTAAQICQAALGVGITPMIRVPAHDAFHSTRLLDTGAQGIVVPHVSTAEQRVRWCLSAGSRRWVTARSRAACRRPDSCRCRCPRRFR